MKVKSQSKKPPQDVSKKSSTANLFLNLIIVVLGILILYMSLSLYQKFAGGGGDGLNANSTKNGGRTIQVEVLNGCGVSGAADKITEFLRSDKFDVVQIGNYVSFDIEKSMVIDRTGNMSNAYKVAAALGIDRKNVIQQVNDNYFLDVSLVIGKDYNKLKPYK